MFENISQMLLTSLILLSYYTKLIYGSCQIVNTTAICETFYDINNLNKSQLITNLKILICHTINNQQNDIQKILLPSTISNLTLENCNLDKIENIPISYKNISYLNLSKNNISIIPWQYVTSNVKNFDLNIKENYLSCSCDNEWIFGFNNDIKTFFSLPQNIYVDNEFKERCRKMKCVREKIESINYRNNVAFGDNIELVCLVNNSKIIKNFQKQKNSNFFRWVTLPKNKNYDKLSNSNNYKEIINTLNGTIKLKINHASEDDLGVIACLCLWCKYPSFSLSEIRIKKNLSIDVFNDGRSDKIIVQGYPLNNLIFKITRLDDNLAEKPIFIGDKTESLFNDTLFLKQETTKEDITNFYIRDLRVFPKECTLCKETTWDLIDKNYEISLCNGDGNCARIKRSIGALNHTTTNNKNYEVYNNKANFVIQTNNNYHINTFFYIISLISIIAIIILTIKYGPIFSIQKKRYTLSKQSSRRTSKTEETILQQTESNITRGNSVSISINSSEYNLKHVPIINIENIEIGKKIGQGAYGEVYHAYWTCLPTIHEDSQYNPLLVVQYMTKKEIAIKTLKNLNFTADWDREAGLLSQLNHNNIVKFFGVSYNLKNEILIVMEYMNLGDLKNYLIKRSPPLTINYSQFPPSLQLNELIEISKQICEGVNYLTSRQIIHRDIAARNCLVSGDSDLMLCNHLLRPKTTIKIGDFGMSRKLYSDIEYYKMGNDEGKLLPCRWLAPECIKLGKFSHYSDIWSFGITIWEVFSYGEVPFKHLNNNEIFSAILNGARPELPKGVPETISYIIENCLKKEPEDRISAIECLTQLNLL
ncbi:Protein kinase domain and Serine-threonine/tyrosine-protein kinase catalytic domain and Protein kinase-like domain and Tyrosine-protein kinase, catalytic domain-containing protein [Strongyloides ratti]|uniref:Protein kinase domain and Serine-threonine/tyrosine-protein kinase catalytic domain and Protein kinase-like domain and Tyrosine-protein kinase, catalytic domain-containing protein n=1 Tax=Strongyloides ratti TaxID=34506 RepID=A0A090KYX2_STRRB|nr:Protein kinase domain and Serine-threonine/tyrosine-protein kinase catalytic domain and Protein kinase-like domain and Tyrosine-protein kinase, catalytic domain-containing protein [Strongyloides ratti]CEF62636.1 Protein kinase domain and Serine-threonine/tyrosine-protein kinase catalytic domain and Protein kinase-like domain and Tyrosine-protein kinase, catalytic domain-containing protein [Strongyloides ratti]